MMSLKHVMNVRTCGTSPHTLMMIYIVKAALNTSPWRFSATQEKLVFNQLSAPLKNAIISHAMELFHVTGL